MSEAATGESFELEVNVVDACEVGPIPRGAERIHWRLLTNHPIGSNDEVAAVLYAYTLRWRIEDLHRTWKSGACQVEANAASLRIARYKMGHLGRCQRRPHRTNQAPGAKHS